MADFTSGRAPEAFGGGPDITRLEHEGDIPVLAVMGEILSEHRKSLQQAIRKHSDPTGVIVDLADCDFLDSSAMGVFLEMHRALQAGQKRLVLVLPEASPIRASFTQMHLERVLNLQPSRAAALAQFAQPMA